MRRALKLVSQGADTVYKRPLSIPEHYNLDSDRFFVDYSIRMYGIDSI